MEKNYLALNNLESYVTSLELSNFVWKIVIKKEWFAKQTVGIQFVKATDSISANIAEGFGRYHKKDKIRFYRYAQGSLKEINDWNQKANARLLIGSNDYSHIQSQIKVLSYTINTLIKYTNVKLKF